ncbi:MAG: ABC transporter ATP-binding protein [Eubacterium sp.]|nr:ABC transporter ATP-binding protein [Eubacterium sp.]
MNHKVIRILKELGLWKTFVIVMILRSPFDFLNSMLNANMLESFIRLTDQRDGDNLSRTFWIFLMFTLLLFAYNASVWATVAVKTDMMLHRRLRMKLLESMLSRTQQEMEEYSEGDWITRINNDVDKVADYLTAPINFMHSMIAVVNLVFSSMILIMLNPTLFGVSIFLMIPFFILSGIVIVRNIPKFRKNAQESFARYTNWTAPIVEAGDAITVFDGQDIVLDKVREESERIMRENVKAHRRTALSSAVTATSGMTGYILLLLIGNSMIGTKIKDFAELMKITQYRGHMMMGVMCVNSGINNMKTNLTGVVRVDEILNDNIK